MVVFLAFRMSACNFTFMTLEGSRNQLATETSILFCSCGNVSCFLTWKDL